ncbi:MAG: hypothetical protein ABS949_06250 [Solibacillus sp.]
MQIAPSISKDTYEIDLVKHLLDIRFLRIADNKFVTARSIADGTLGFETEDSLCKEWLNSVYDSYSFYDGFDTFEDCQLFIFNESHYPNHYFRIVKFLTMYYAVIYENTQFQQVIGKDICYYNKNNLVLVGHRPPSNLTHKDRPALPVIPLIYHELYAFDPQITTYHLPDAMATQFVECPVHDTISYIVLLGVTFKDIWYLCNTPHTIAHNRALLNLYFTEGHGFTLFGKYSKAIAINPFQRLISLAHGRIEHFQMNIDDYRTPQRLLPYREVRRFHENMRHRPVQFEE